jgi:predicted kinase
LLEYAHKFHAENPTISKEQLLEEVVSFGKKEQCEPNDNYEPHKKKLVKILRGIPGSGKSYYARTVKDATIISTDNYFISDGVYTFDKSKLGEAHKSTFKGFVSLIINPEFSGTIIIDNTNITIAEIAPYYSVAAAYDWDVEIITFDTPFRMCVDRQTHGVSMQTMQQRSSLMHKEDNNFPAYWKKRRIITVDTQLTSDQEIALKVLDTLNGDGCGGGRSRTCTPDIEQHTCPYREEIHNDNFTLCRCCDTCSHECAMDI